jgi:hypothetical protein
MAVDARRPPAARATSRPRPKRQREEEVLVWPDLVFIEFIAAVLFTINFLILSVFVNAPLLNRANPDVTPNPSKAPWYFLNLQELLLHMDKAWAGVLLPTIALIFFASIPYIDRSHDGQGIWFGSKYSVRLTLIATVYAVFVSGLLVAFDSGERSRFEYLTRWIPSCDNEAQHAGLPCLRDEEGAKHLGILNTKDIAKRLRFSVLLPRIGGAPGDANLDWPEDFDRVPWPLNDTGFSDFKFGSFHGWHGEHLNVPSAVAEQVIPLTTIVFFAGAIIYVLFRVGWLRTKRDLFIVMFTAVIFAYLALSMVGAFFRGEGQGLIWPTEIKVDEG